MKKIKREEFTDQQKAEIYARDRALCAFSGKSLWILDYGLSPTYQVDWVDHIKPAAKGGGNTIDNGVCSSSFYNEKKRANGNDNKYLFFAGRPTSHFYYFYEVIPAHIASHLQRFGKIDVSDWYFNRAVYRFMNGLWRIRAESKGRLLDRDKVYYAKSSAKILKKWKTLAIMVDDFETRGMAAKPLSADQEILLSIRDCCNESDVLELMQVATPWFNSSVEAMNQLARINTKADIASLVSYIDEQETIAHRVKHMMLENISALSQFLA